MKKTILIGSLLLALTSTASFAVDYCSIKVTLHFDDNWIYKMNVDPHYLAWPAYLQWESFYLTDQNKQETSMYYQTYGNSPTNEQHTFPSADIVYTGSVPCGQTYTPSFIYQAYTWGRCGGDSSLTLNPVSTIGTSMLYVIFPTDFYTEYCPN